MSAVLASFLQYFVIMVVLAIVALAGAFTGRKLRENKNAKEAPHRPQINQRR